MQVKFWFDVTCPWAYVTSRWYSKVANELNISTQWEIFSLSIKNRSNNKNYSVKDFVEYCFKLVNLDWKKYVNVDVNRYKRPAEVDNLLGDSSKARKILGWKPKINFEQLCKMMLEYDLKTHGLTIDEVKKKGYKIKNR